MIARFCRWLSRRLQRRAIHGDDGALYLERFRLFGWMPGDARSYPFSVYLHRFHLPDTDAPGVLHNHPWKWAFSIVLSGGYTEESKIPGCKLRTRHRLSAPSLNIIVHDFFHRIDELHGEVWTLFVVGPRVSSWGFHVPGRGFVPWKQRLAERGIPV